MKVAVTGRGGAGSWQMRGEQLGGAIGAHVQPKMRDFAGFDVVVVVKRTPADLIARLKASKVPWVYDPIDCYPQPACAEWDRDRAILWVRETLVHLKPHGVIWPTERMRDDCDPFHRIKSVVIPHHCRPRAAINPIRERIARVGYEGATRYLACWENALRRECENRNIEFVCNPAELADVDVVVAFRGGEWSNYATRHWKSHVKLADAHGTGTPFIGQRERGYIENACGREFWAESLTEFRLALDWMAERDVRAEISERFREKAYRLEDAAAALRGFLEAA